LVWPGEKRQFFCRREFSFEIDPLLRPQFFHQKDGLISPFAALFPAHTDRFEISRIIAAQSDD
jgi:hypothetical protein